MPFMLFERWCGIHDHKTKMARVDAFSSCWRCYRRPNSGADTEGVGLNSFGAELEKLEKKSGGRLGVAFLDTATSTRAGQRTGERFPMCSTFKLLAGGAVLVRVDQEEEHLDRIVLFTQKDIVSYSPVPQTRVGDAVCQSARYVRPPLR